MLSAILNKTINDELEWREPEMALAKLNLHRAIGDKSAFRFAYRCFAAMTCAHYEGFVKKVIAQALSDLLNSGIKASEFNDAIRLSLFVPGARKHIATTSNAELLDIFFKRDKVLDFMSLPYDEKAITECGNLNYETFSWAASCIGLDCEKFKSYKASINRLVMLRHECAHGDLLTFDATVTDRALASTMFLLQDAIITLMHALAVEVIDHFTQKDYLWSSVRGGVSI